MPGPQGASAATAARPPANDTFPGREAQADQSQEAADDESGPGKQGGEDGWRDVSHHLSLKESRALAGQDDPCKRPGLKR